MRLSSLIRQNSYIIDRVRLAVTVRAKWYYDSCNLPLTNAHWDLYNIIHAFYWRELHEFPNLVCCRDFNDRIQWLKLFDQSTDNVRCSDKYLVRDYIRERIGNQYLTELYQVHDRFSQIDFETLPNAFVIKANHDCGTVILVRDKDQLDKVAAEKRIESALITTYGWEKGEWAYAAVKPTVFVEQLIEPGSLIPPADYKFHCVDGIVRYLHYIYDRGHDTRELFVNRNGYLSDLSIYFPKGDPARYIEPNEWNRMVQVAEALAKGFKYVRVDLYLSQGKIYVGEMTFWPMSGCYHSKGQKLLGACLDFDRNTFKDPIYNRYMPLLSSS